MKLVCMFLYLYEVYVCVNIPDLRSVGGLYMRAYNAVLFFTLAGLNQGQKNLRSPPPEVSSLFKGSPRQSPWPCSG